jgi:hypothetical protein
MTDKQMQAKLREKSEEQVEMGFGPSIVAMRRGKEPQCHPDISDGGGLTGEDQT